eukprot:NODE_17624_length_933_cov_10.362283.p2 GENE.NODE_17624_length_933_cov_10.362283~~NODE_17624_length_933_cov_10.362283.p2  ORF type:complete len:224 (-),score=64.90 NODE_17624_length_933_cov_10.362283:262-846(-)
MDCMVPAAYCSEELLPMSAEELADARAALLEAMGQPQEPEPEDEPAPRENAANNATTGDGTEGPSPPGPEAFSVQLMWGVETMTRQPYARCGRFVYKSRGSVDGRGGIELSYAAGGQGGEGGEGDAGGSWEIGGPSSGCLYRIRSDALTPQALIGRLPWTRSYGGVIYLTLVVSAATQSGGWIDPQLLAFNKKW